MRLAPCLNCRRPVEDTARFCPHCGVRNPLRAARAQPDLPPSALPQDDGSSLAALFAGTACAGATIGTMLAVAVTIGIFLAMLAAVLQFLHALLTCKM